MLDFQECKFGLGKLGVESTPNYHIYTFRTETFFVTMLAKNIMNTHFLYREQEMQKDQESARNWCV